jgi:hypothetical protein
VIDGYAKVHDGDGCLILGSQQVAEFLRNYRKKGRRESKAVDKVGLILKRIAEYGFDDMKNKEQFRHEGKFAGGGRRGGEFAVFAVKSDQLRIYGGLGKGLAGKPTFVCVEAVAKQKDKADQSLLARVARTLGEIHDHV